MATTPTNLPVPSESPRDLKFNAGKIDEFVTSFALSYIDRFGDELDLPLYFQTPVIT